MSDILKIEDLVIQYDTDSGCVHALNGLSLTLREGETLGLVGETGMQSLESPVRAKQRWRAASWD